MAEKRVFKLIYIDNHPESVTQLKRIIRTYGLNSDVIIDVTDLATLDALKAHLESEQCDLILIKNREDLPSIEEVSKLIDIMSVSIIAVAESGELESSLNLIDLGASEVVMLSNPTYLYKKIMGALRNRQLTHQNRELRASIKALKEQAESFLTQTSEGVAYAVDGMFTYYNESFWDQLGYSSENEFLGVLLLDIVAPNYLDLFKRQASKALRSDKPVEVEGELINVRTQKPEKMALSLSKVMFEGEEALEIKMLSANSESTAPTATKADEYPILSFIDRLGDHIGTGNWLLTLKIEDYISIWSKYGPIRFEEYMRGLQKQLEAQFQGLSLVRYSDSSYLLIVEGADMTSIDRISNTIETSISSYEYSLADGTLITSSAKSAYTSLSIKASDLNNVLHTLERQLGIIPTINATAAATSATQEEPSGEATKEGESPEQPVDYGEYTLLAEAIKESRISYTYAPVADFAKNRESYLTHYDILDENKNIISWNKSFMNLANNPVAKQLDSLIIQNGMKELLVYGSVKQLFITLTATMIFDRAFAEAIFKAIKGYRLQEKILLLFSKDLLNAHPQHIAEFFAYAQSEGIQVGIFGISSEEELPLIEPIFASMSVAMLSGNMITRLSRTSDAGRKASAASFFETLHDHEIAVLADNIDVPTTMASVWEFNIDSAAGEMIGMPNPKMEFDFSQIII